MPAFDKSLSFEQIDTNNDAIVTREEFAHWRKKVAAESISSVKKGTEKITWEQLRLLAVVSAVPMVCTLRLDANWEEIAVFLLQFIQFAQFAFVMLSTAGWFRIRGQCHHGTQCLQKSGI